MFEFRIPVFETNKRKRAREGGSTLASATGSTLRRIERRKRPSCRCLSFEFRFLRQIKENARAREGVPSRAPPVLRCAVSNEKSPSCRCLSFRIPVFETNK